MICRIRTSSLSALTILAALGLPSLASAEPIIGLGADGESLVRFDSATPATAADPVAVTGLPGDTELLAIDVRPSTGVLYGLGDDSRIYTLTEAGVATPVSATPFAPALDTDGLVGFDFNNVSEGIRIATDKRQNLRIDATTGVATTDTGFTYANVAFAALRAASPIELTAVAYSPNVGNATSLFGIDANNRELVVITGADGNLSQVTPVPTPALADPAGNTLGIDPTDEHCGFDISPEGIAYLTATDGDAGPAFYTVTLSGNGAGVVTKVGDLAANLRDIAVVIAADTPDGGASSSSGGTDGGSTSSSGGSSGASSSSGSSGRSSSSGGTSGGGASSGAGTSGGASGTSDPGAVDRGVGGLEGGGGCAAASRSETPWSVGGVLVGLGLLLTRMRRRTR